MPKGVSDDSEPKLQIVLTDITPMIAIMQKITSLYSDNMELIFHQQGVEIKILDVAQIFFIHIFLDAKLLDCIPNGFVCEQSGSVAFTAKDFKVALQGVNKLKDPNALVYIHVKELHTELISFNPCGGDIIYSVRNKTLDTVPESMEIPPPYSERVIDIKESDIREYAGALASVFEIISISIDNTGTLIFEGTNPLHEFGMESCFMQCYVKHRDTHPLLTERNKLECRIASKYLQAVMAGSVLGKEDLCQIRFQFQDEATTKTGVMRPLNIRFDVPSLGFFDIFIGGKVDEE